MERKEFIKHLGLGALVVPVVGANGMLEAPADPGQCLESPRETAGPFPTKDPSKMLAADIRGDRKGIEMNVKITIQNKNNNCRALPGALVDIWHCDKDGLYSEYGGTRMQTVNLQSAHFLRGRQRTDANGVATFTTIFPGWYGGRAPHIHVEIFDASEKSLLVTQIAFPQEICDTVYTKAIEFYTRGKQDTLNQADGVFADSLNNQMASVSGNITKGFVVSNTIIVNT
jgi:protocatechuate 3,4-dioxygenase beta subunit